MVYIVTRTFNTASWIYYGRREEGGRILSPRAPGSRCRQAVRCFPQCSGGRPRSYANRIYNVQHWTEMPRGGHFAAMEEPQLLLADIRDFARSLRRSS